MSEETKKDENGRIDRIEAVLEGLLGVGDSAKPEEQYGKEEYECEGCGMRVQKEQKHCSGCGKPLKWSDANE